MDANGINNFTDSIQQLSYVDGGTEDKKNNWLIGHKGKVVRNPFETQDHKGLLEIISRFETIIKLDVNKKLPDGVNSKQLNTAFDSLKDKVQNYTDRRLRHAVHRGAVKDAFENLTIYHNYAPTLSSRDIEQK